MPIYRWINTLNGREVEVIRSVSQYDLPPQPQDGECAPHETTWERVITPVNFQLAGTGWAKDGYRSRKEIKK
jgi:predicted nucleic acid-binding Zn ribbon protein